MDYVDFVKAQIEKYRKVTDVMEAGEISPASVYHNLAVYSDVNLMLNMEYQRYKSEYRKIKREFDMWFDERFTSVRRSMNDINLPASKWASKQEIEAETKVQNKEEYLSWVERLEDVEDHMNFFRRLLDQWKTHSYILKILSDNLRQEMSSLSLENNVPAHAYTQASTPKQSPPVRRRVV